MPSSLSGGKTSPFFSEACCSKARFLPSNKDSLENASRKLEGLFKTAALERRAFSSNSQLGSRIVTELLDRRRGELQSRGIRSITAAYRPAGAPGGMEGEAPQILRPQVAIYWDLDNKTPNQDPRVVADRIRAIGERFGQVKEFRAYANRHTFQHIPSYVREERELRKQVRLEERQGVRVSDEPYRCGVCGAKLKTADKLEKHFKQLHERERQKKVNRAQSLSKKKPSQSKRLFAKIKEKDARNTYFDVARDIITPKVGYRLMSDLKSRGVRVREVKDQSQAADAAIISDLEYLLTKPNHVESVVLVSDDSDFGRALARVRASERRVVVVGEKPGLVKSADVLYHWWDVHEGLANRPDYRCPPERFEHRQGPRVGGLEAHELEADDYEEFEEFGEGDEFGGLDEYGNYRDADVDEILFGRSFEESRSWRR
ncbi:C2H2 zinc finger protein [Klebsormidium nitens]|uniref:C2H2 zinc finger protein n=1 Tax=Klebsormidium nitens TaxID=105231 RepID=A0A0U9HIL0_KLENI|nr:C2H2 zinc finger protein [Klebsormidium nitens]|eukprot:GAQ80235.1 C2H2 zinc finger protein [Klebsormidium nitens]